jgi:hypothetical protein
MNAATESSPFLFRVERGRTAFPDRPVHRDRFLIGAGSNCHLQLGGDFPILHSIVIPRGDELWIDAVVPSPMLIVNGQPVRESSLKQGDVIEIGEFVFTVRKKEPAESNVQPCETEEPVPQRMSATELVEQIETELNRIDQFETSREQGAQALLQAVLHAGLPTEEEEASTPGDSLHRLFEELEARAKQLDEREQLLQEHAQRLEQAQRQLQEQIALLHGHLDAESQEESLDLRLTA